MDRKSVQLEMKSTQANVTTRTSLLVLALQLLSGKSAHCCHRREIGISANWNHSQTRAEQERKEVGRSRRFGKAIVAIFGQEVTDSFVFYNSVVGVINFAPDLI